MCVLTRECQGLLTWFHSQTTVLIKHDHSVEPLLALEDTICPITVEEIETTVLKKMEMFKCEYPRLESLLKDTRFPSTHESPVEERVIQQFAQSLESETASSEIILQQRRSRQWKISTAKQWSLLISAIEDDTSLFPNTFSSTVPRSPPCTSFTSISSASRHHLPRWKEVSLFRDALCWVEEMGSVIRKTPSIS